MRTAIRQSGFKPCWRHNPRRIRVVRGYNGTSTGAHTTYFQPPPQQAKPRRRIFRSILLATSCIGIGAYAHSWLFDLPFLGLGLELADELPQGLAELEDAMAAGVQDAAARQVPPMDLARAQEILESRSGYSVTLKAVAHTSQHPSNLPCEDTWSSGAFTYFNDPQKDWCEWAIFDGHAGPRTSQVLKEACAGILGDALWKARCMDRPYTPNDQHIFNTIKSTFSLIDHDICNQALSRIRSDDTDKAQTVALASAAFSGSCALLAIFDPARSILRVANTGDSRAVLGRWDDSTKRYVAQPMSVDQTGFNQEEVERLKREHPDEDVVDPETGRVFGLAVSRAFGDARWKWPHNITERAHKLFWGPSPRPNNVIKTPPYLTAEPEVTEVRLQTGEHADFLIMASDGLWDNMSSEDAVTCVQMWLDKKKPTTFLEKMKKEGLSSITDIFRGGEPPQAPTFSSADDLTGDDDTYYDANEKCLKWRVSPKYFVVEDENCGNHLIKNALGGNRRGLYTSIMSVQPPLSRNVRDDITVHVVFFGVDTEAMINN